MGTQKEKVSHPQVSVENCVLNTTNYDPLWQNCREPIMGREHFKQDSFP